MVTGEAGETSNLVKVLSSRFSDSTTETLRLVADNSRAIAASIAASNERIAQSEERIEQILEYLFRERPNGRGGGE